MRKLLFICCFLFSAVLFAQDFAIINKMQEASLQEAKDMTFHLVNLSDQKFQFFKEKETSEYYLLIYIPVGLTTLQIEESRVNRYDNGVVFKLSKHNNQKYKLLEFYAEPKLMFVIVKEVFYPDLTYNDFINTHKYSDFKNTDKKFNFYFYKGDSLKDKYRFYSF